MSLFSDRICVGGLCTPHERYEVYKGWYFATNGRVEKMESIILADV